MNVSNHLTLETDLVVFFSFIQYLSSLVFLNIYLMIFLEVFIYFLIFIIVFYIIQLLIQLCSCENSSHFTPVIILQILESFLLHFFIVISLIDSLNYLKGFCQQAFQLPYQKFFQLIYLAFGIRYFSYKFFQ